VAGFFELVGGGQTGDPGSNNNGGSFVHGCAPEDILMYQIIIVLNSLELVS
jgi:hypothetical protein